MTDPYQPSHATSDQPAGPVSISTGAVALVVVAFLAVVGAYVALILAGRPTDDLAGLIDRALAAAGAFGGIGGLIFAGSAARNARAAKVQTNGSLDARMEQAVSRGISRGIIDAQDSRNAGTIPPSIPD